MSHLHPYFTSPHIILCTVIITSWHHTVCSRSSHLPREHTAWENSVAVFTTAPPVPQSIPALRASGSRCGLGSQDLDELSGTSGKAGVGSSSWPRALPAVLSTTSISVSHQWLKLKQRMTMSWAATWGQLSWTCSLQQWQQWQWPREHIFGAFQCWSYSLVPHTPKRALLGRCCHCDFMPREMLAQGNQEASPSSLTSWLSDWTLALNYMLTASMSPA